MIAKMEMNLMHLVTPQQYFLRATQNAAIACYSSIGQHDRMAADKYATDAMRTTLNLMPFRAIVQIGEGERDEAPMLFRGEKLGKSLKNAEVDHSEIDFDIAVDPLEGTNLCAENKPNSICILMYGAHGSILSAPDCYMEKLMTRENCGISLDYTLKENLNILAKSKNCNISDLTVAMLNRPRHKKYYNIIHELGANLHLFEDGDIMMAMNLFSESTDPTSLKKDMGNVQNSSINNVEKNLAKVSIDMYYGIGGAPEGVIAAGLMKNLGGFMDGRLILNSDNEGGNSGTKYSIHDMVNGDVTICISGVTDGNILNGVKKRNDIYEVESLIIGRQGNDLIYDIINESFNVQYCNVH